MTPSVCIAIPFYENLAYLDVALRSLIAQTDADWNAVIVDDSGAGSEVGERVAELGEARISYVRNDCNLGIAANFNRCLELGEQSAEIVTILHADDALEAGYVAAIRAGHRTFPTAACVAPRATVIDAAGRPTRTLADSVKRLLWPRSLPFILEGDRGLARLMHGLFFYCPAVSYRVDLLPPLRFDDRWRQVMDLDLFARLMLGGGSIALVPERVYRYRRHDAAMSAQNAQSRVRTHEEVAVTREIVAEARDRHWSRTVRAGRLRATGRLNVWWSRHT